MTKDDEPWRDMTGHILTPPAEPAVRTPSRTDTENRGERAGPDFLWLLILAAAAATLVGAYLALDA